MNLAHWLQRAGMAHGDLTAIAMGTRPFLSYGRLAERTARLASAFRSVHGLHPGDRVALVAKNCPEYLEVLFGIWHAGLVAVPVNAKLHGAEVAFILEDSEASLCFCSDSLAAEISAHKPATLRNLIEIGSDAYDDLFNEAPMPLQSVAADDLAWLFYTSGTTGRPKGAMLSHGNLVAMSLGYLADVDTVAPGDAIIHAAPLSHGGGLYALPHICNMGVNVIPESGGFEPVEIFELWAEWGNCSMFAAPTMVKRLVECPLDAPAIGLKNIIYGGGPMYVADAKAALQRLGPHLSQIYGQGESPMTITVLTRHVIADQKHERWEERLGSVGLANSTVEVAVVDEDGHPLPPGESGEIIVKGPPVMLGYWRNEEATAKTIRDGWLFTGDMGVMDDEGFITLKDRSKDVIISGGTNIYPREVEEVLLTHPKVREVSVIGRADPEWGEVVVAYVVGEASAEELDALCLRKIARFKRPKDYLFLESLPKNNYGKILKTELRERDAAR